MMRGLSLSVLVVALAAHSGCGSVAGYPAAPKVRIEAPAGTPVGYTVTYFDGKDSVDITASGKSIPESGVFSEDLAAGHEGVLIQVIPNRAASLTLILLDGTKELQRSTARNDKDTATVSAGKIWLDALPGSRR